MLRQMDRLLAVRALARPEHLFDHGGYLRSSLAISPTDELAVLVSAGKNPEQVVQHRPEDAVSPAVSNHSHPSCCYSRVPTVTSRSHAIRFRTKAQRLLKFSNHRPFFESRRSVNIMAPEQPICTAITPLNCSLAEVGLASSFEAGARLFPSPYLAYAFNHAADRASTAIPRYCFINN